VANVSHEEMCQRSVEVRGLKTIVSEIEIPCAFGPAYEGERVRGADLYAQCGGGKTQCTELVKMAEMNEIEDGKVKSTDRISAISKKAKPSLWAFSSRWPAAKCRPTSSRSWNARSTI
jgi:hypothetical protein